MSASVVLPLNAGHSAIPRNEGRPFDRDWIDDIRVNLSAAERRVTTLPGRRTVKKEAQAAWLLKAIACIDLTTLNGDDTAERVKRLCAKAKAPVRQDILEALDFAAESGLKEATWLRVGRSSLPIHVQSATVRARRALETKYRAQKHAKVFVNSYLCYGEKYNRPICWPKRHCDAVALEATAFANQSKRVSLDWIPKMKCGKSHGDFRQSNICRMD